MSQLSLADVHRWAWRVARVLVCLLVLALVAAMAGAYFGSVRLAGQVDRVPGVFAGVPAAGRPPETPGLTILLMGSDSQAADSGAADAAAGHSDVVMLVRVDERFSHASFVSIPSDSWVAVPGHGMAEINASFGYGGPSLLVQTVEGVTGLRVDHFAVIDFAGFRTLTDAVGGIDVNIAAPTTFGSLALHAGINHLDGEQALGYVRQRDGLPHGDLDRVRRHQNAIRALFAKAVSTGLKDPVRAYGFATELTRWIAVDDTMTDDRLRDIATRLPGLSPGNITFLTAPVSGSGSQGGQSVVYLDTDRGARLWRMLAADDVEDYVRTDPGSVLGPTTP